MDDQFSIDITDHRPRDVEDVSMSDFDYVVAMEPYIADDLAHRFGLPAARIIIWEVDDPVGGGASEYRRCVDDITRGLKTIRREFSIEPR